MYYLFALLLFPLLALPWFPLFKRASGFSCFLGFTLLFPLPALLPSVILSLPQTDLSSPLPDSLEKVLLLSVYITRALQVKSESHI